MVDDGDLTLTLTRIRSRLGRAHAEGRVYAPWEQIQNTAELFTIEHPERFASFRRGFETCFVDVRSDGHILDATVEIRLVNDRERSSRLLLRWTPRLRVLPTSLGAARRDLRDFVLLLGTVHPQPRG